mgnify:CR=1 FL=1
MIAAAAVDTVGTEEEEEDTIVEVMTVVVTAAAEVRRKDATDLQQPALIAPIAREADCFSFLYFPFC